MESKPFIIMIILETGNTITIPNLTCARIVRFFQHCSEVALKTSTLSATHNGTEAVVRTRHTGTLTN